MMMKAITKIESKREQWPFTSKSPSVSNLSTKERDLIIKELAIQLSAQIDGSRKNLICDCPYCGKSKKFGIYIGSPTERKPMLASHCFSCGKSHRDINHLLLEIGRSDLVITATTELNTPLENLLFPLDPKDEIEDDLIVVELPDFYKRVFTHPYLKGRGFDFDDFEYFPVGTTRGLNWKYDNYVIFPVIDDGDVVGYVARHLWNKGVIDDHNRRTKRAQSSLLELPSKKEEGEANRKAKRKGEYTIRRFNNSMENDFAKLIYNYDTIIDKETHTVIIVEGIFDVVALTRKLDLYDRVDIAVVATFGKKVSHIQIYKLQTKGVRTVIIAFDGDAVQTIKFIATELSKYFKVFIADISDPSMDWDDLDVETIAEIFDSGLKTPIQYKLTRI